MALHWDLSKIENREEVCFRTGDDGERHLSAVTHVLIFGTLTADIGTITESNAAEFYARIKLAERLDGPFLVGKDGDVEITFEDVRAHIGLHTNATFKDGTRAAFLKRLAGRAMDEWAATAKRKQAESAIVKA